MKIRVYYPTDRGSFLNCHVDTAVFVSADNFEKLLPFADEVKEVFR
jgi:hypothetical protein